MSCGKNDSSERSHDALAFGYSAALKSEPKLPAPSARTAAVKKSLLLNAAVS